MSFDYSRAFVRNLGFVTEKEQQILRNSKVAIAGLGGVGGSHLITLARLGVGSFHIADPDEFEIQNFNRQAGADLDSIGKSKADIMKTKALLINSEIKIKSYSEAITEKNSDEFLEGVDLFVDGLDVSALDARAHLFKKCKEKGIPALTVAPVGMGAALLNFLPGKMSFEEYFGFDNKTEEEKFMRLILGITPSFIQMKSLVDRTIVNPKERKGPSTPMGCQLASGVLGTQVLKILLHRKGILCAPTGLHFDAYSSRLRKSWMPFGHRNPIFKLKLMIFKNIFKAGS